MAKRKKSNWRAEFMDVRVKDQDAMQAARREWCEYGRRCWVTPEQVHVHHVKSRGAGGSDVPDNLVSLCWVCHAKLHAANFDRAAFEMFVELRNRLRAAMGGELRCECGCERFNYFAPTATSGARFECDRCRKGFADSRERPTGRTGIEALRTGLA